MELQGVSVWANQTGWDGRGSGDASVVRGWQAMGSETTEQSPRDAWPD
jgi:hypothetical protein